MKLIWIVVLIFGLLTVQAFAEGPPDLKSRTDKDSYSTGVNIVRTLKQQGGEVNLDAMIQGIKDGLTGEKLLMTEDELRKTMAELQTEMARRQQQAATKRNEMKGGAVTANAGPGDGDAILKEEGRVQKAEQRGQLTPNKVGTSIPERYTKRSEVKKRAAEMRRKLIEQERQRAENDQPLGAI